MKDVLSTTLQVNKFYNIEPSGLCYKHMAIVNYASSIVNKQEALPPDDARVVIHDRHVFIVQATGCYKTFLYNGYSCECCNTRDKKFPSKSFFYFHFLSRKLGIL